MTGALLPSARHAVVLFAHGSRDPLWRAPIEAVAHRIAAEQPERPVACAYLELCDPPLDQAVDDLAGRGAQAVTIVPMFLGTGKHARADLPVLVQQIRARHPHLLVHVQTAVGEDPRMTALMAEIACELPRS